MGFSLEMFFEELQEILNKDQKAAKTVRQLRKLIDENQAYAKSCGLIN